MKAILLAAGTGSRLRPLTDHTPKALVEVGGTPIIERQIQFFRERGIADIVVVTGHLHERFRDLPSRYPGLRLVHNDAYAGYNNIYSVYRVRGELGDSYVSEADVFMHRNYIDPCPHGSCYYGGARRGFDREWVLAFDADRRIGRVDVHGGSGVVMAGLSYWAPRDAVLLRAALEKRIDDGGFAGAYWDEVPMSLLDAMPVFLHEIDPEDWSEIDTPADLARAEELDRERARQRR